MLWKQNGHAYEALIAAFYFYHYTRLGFTYTYKIDKKFNVTMHNFSVNNKRFSFTFFQVLWTPELVFSDPDPTCQIVSGSYMNFIFYF
jgi:hypothetical protein